MPSINTKGVPRFMYSYFYVSMYCTAKSELAPKFVRFYFKNRAPPTYNQTGISLSHISQHNLSVIFNKERRSEEPDKTYTIMGRVKGTPKDIHQAIIQSCRLDQFVFCLRLKIIHKKTLFFLVFFVIHKHNFARQKIFKF